METEISGTGVALVTPFTKDLEVDYVGLEKLVNHVIKGGIDYLVVLGTTGETTTLTEDEKKQVLATVKKVNNGRLPIVLGHGGNNTASLVESFKDLDLDGITAILSVVPPYNRPNQEGLYQHYKAFAKACPLPFILYNVPGRTGVNLEVETTLKLAKEFDNILGVKEASGDMNQIMQILRSAPQGFQVISGDDGITVPLVSVGAHGLISVVANAFPTEISMAVRSALKGDFQTAKENHYKLWDLMALSFADGNPGGVKCMMEQIGLIENNLRLPLAPVKQEVADKIAVAVGKI
ncbi:MAG: 4-hydroxy-tetrahydrodipicolinate synthase [Glaciecola sp.]|jgi:4-hydroxy-tetrahydrodipicolinate synthase